MEILMNFKVNHLAYIAMLSPILPVVTGFPIQKSLILLTKSSKNKNGKYDKKLPLLIFFFLEIPRLFRTVDANH